MQPISNHQIKTIHTALYVLKIDDESYRKILTNRYEKSSSKQLSYLEAIDFIYHLKDCGFKPIRHKKATIKRNGKIIKLASPYQMNLINVLKANISWTTSYNAWLATRMKITNVVTANEAYKVIEGLKAMLHITDKDIEHCNLPFPNNYDIANITDKWFYDASNNQLYHVKNGEIVER